MNLSPLFLFNFGGRYIPYHNEPLHCVLFGSTGSGKSTIMERMIGAKAPLIDLLPNYRALCVDTKINYTSLLHALNAPLALLNPLDRRSIAWSWKDLQGPAFNQEVAAGLVRADKVNNDNKYFYAAAHILIKGLLEVLEHVLGDDRDLRHLILSFESVETARQILARHSRPAEFSDFLKSSSNGRNEVLTTVKSILTPYETIAAIWSSGKQSVSVEDVLHGAQKFWVLGSDFAHDDILNKVNTLFLHFLFKALKSLPDDPNRRIFIFLDELQANGPYEDLETVLAIGRSKGISFNLAFQSIPGLIDHYGSEEKVKNLLGLCRHWGILGVDAFSAEWLARHLGSYEYIQQKFSRTYAKEGSSNESYAVSTRQVILPQELMDSNPAFDLTYGIAGYYTAPGSGIWFHRYSWEEINAFRVQRLTSVPDYDRLDSRDPRLVLNPWSSEERARLGLTDPPPPDDPPSSRKPTKRRR